MKKKIGVLIGSLRKNAFSRKVANRLIDMLPDQLALEIVEINDLPFYNEDLEENTPPAWTNFRDKIRSLDGLIFVTPEYNRSVPAALKNALDVGSRPYAQSCWDGKPAGVISISQGGLGGFGANHHLRQSLVCLNVPTLPQPEMYIGSVAQVFDANNEITNPQTKALLHKFLLAFNDWVS